MHDMDSTTGPLSTVGTAVNGGTGVPCMSSRAPAEFSPIPDRSRTCPHPTPNSARLREANTASRRETPVSSFGWELRKREILRSTTNRLP